MGGSEDFGDDEQPQVIIANGSQPEFDFDDEAEVKRLVPAVLEMINDPVASKRKVVKAQEFVRKRQQETMQVVRKELVI